MIRKLFGSFVTCLGFFLLLLATIPICVYVVELYSGHKGLTDGPGGLVITTLIFGVPGMVLVRMSRRDRLQQQMIKNQEEQERERLRQAREDEQERIRQTVTELVSGTRGTIENLPSVIAQAEADLDQAEVEFTDGAFAPFWDAVEKAVSGLATYDGGIRAIAHNSKQIVQEVKKLDPPPRVDFPNDPVPEALPTIHRMGRIVRQAQKDFHFATIYEQRRTNGILVAGFANLGRALDDMGSRIERSVSELSDDLTSALSSMSETNAQHLQELISGMTGMRDQLASDSEMRRGHEGNVEEMLDNIQRRRKPLPRKFRDNQY